MHYQRGDILKSNKSHYLLCFMGNNNKDGNNLLVANLHTGRRLKSGKVNDLTRITTTELTKIMGDFEFTRVREGEAI